MDYHPPPPPAPALPSSSSNASITMVIITVAGILAAFALLASYYAFVTRCQLFRALSWSRNNPPPWHHHHRRARQQSESIIRSTTDQHRGGLGLPLIRMLPVVKFTAADAASDLEAAGTGRISVSECAVCLSEFVERERVRLLPNCSHAFHIDCIDTWLQGSARCPFCRSDVTLPPLMRANTSTTGRSCCSHRPRDADELVVASDSNSIVIEVRGEHETWVGGHGGAGRRHHRQQKQKGSKAAESVGDEAIDTRNKDEAFAVPQPLRRSLSLDSSCCDKQRLVESVRELLITTRRQVYDDPSAI